jgi:cell division septum initiation protein DivIVA
MTNENTVPTAQEMDILLKCLDKGAEYRSATGEYSAFIGQLEKAYPTLRDYIHQLQSKIKEMEEYIQYCEQERGIQTAKAMFPHLSDD